jgi:hypothetical protein
VSCASDCDGGALVKAPGTCTAGACTQ